ncbi:HEAT repeat domain-containing protein [bacterium]|nr:HEAT repeat domain-containing protein [bacterium]
MKSKNLIRFSLYGTLVFILALAGYTFAGQKMSFEEAFAKKNAASKAAYQKTAKKTEWNADIQAHQLQEKYAKEVEANIQRVEEGLASTEVRCDRAILNLARAKDPKAVPILSKFILQDDCAYDRKTAAEALQAIGDPIAIPALEAALEDKDYRVRVNAASALVAFKQYDAAFPTLKNIALKKNIENWVIDYSGEGRIKNQPDYKGDIQIINDFLPSEALLALGDINDKKSIEVIKQCLQDENSFVRFHAGFILLEKKDTKKALPVLEKIINNPNITISVRASAIRAIVQSNGTQEKKLINDFLNSSDPQIVKHTKRAISLHKRGL